MPDVPSDPTATEVALDAKETTDTGPDTRCEAPCEEGATRCAGNGFQTCVLDTDTQCPSWSAIAPCATPSTCSNGVCSATCSDECAPTGLRVCEGDDVLVCGQSDSDACLDWGARSPCGMGRACVNGECRESCADDCDAISSSRCDGDGVQTCGHVDADSCLDWSSAESFDKDEACNDGVCVSTDPCPDDCQIGGASCSGTTGFRACVATPETGCSEPGLFGGCQIGNTCQGGACTGSSTLGQVWSTIESATSGFIRAAIPKAAMSVRMCPGTGCDAAATVGPLSVGTALDGLLTPPTNQSSTPIAAALAGLFVAGRPDPGAHGRPRHRRRRDVRDRRRRARGGPRAAAARRPRLHHRRRRRI